MRSLLQFVLVIVLTVNSITSIPLNVFNADPLKCDLSRCTKPDPNKLNVHLVPHTHDDVGWLKTVDQYYYGANSNIQKAGVQYIIDSAVNSLLQNDKRRFIYVETAFFWKWWKEQDDIIKGAVKELVANGRLEFISGGWSMNDEATTHYNSIVDQMTWGFRRLEDEFGKCGIPKIGWQIDPFGHSREMANLLSQMNFDGLFFARLDYEDHQKRRSNKTMELVWQGSDDLGKSSNLFTGAMDMGYGPPPTFCWDLVGCNDDPFIDDPESEDYNVDKIVDRFINYAKAYSAVYATNNLLFPMGTDFQYQDAHAWFKNMDKLVKYVTAKGSNVNVFYSTPSCYLNAVQQSNQTFTTKSDDFFPYGSDPHSYWTGYFTSRPALKRYERVGNNILQVCKQMDVLAQLKVNLDEEITSLREAMGILQHHDAVSGTEKQHVANNYALKLAQGIEKCKKVVNEAYKTLLLKPDSKEQVNQVFCDALNISSCAITEGNDSIAVTIYNPIGRPVTQSIRLPITNKAYQVFDPSGKTVASGIFPIPDYVLKIPGRVSKATNELVFQVDLPPLGFATYLVKQNSAEPSSKASVVTKISQSFSVKAKSFDVLFEADGGLKGIQLPNGNVVKVGQDFEYYKAMNGDNKKAENRASGAYVFRPDGQTPVRMTKIVESNLVETEVVKEVHQKLDSYITQVIRVYPNEDFVEFDYVVGPIPVDDKIGKEIISRFESNLTTNGVFFTDANGRQILKRVRNSRPTWNYTITEPTSGNYYPVNSRIFIRDEKQDIQMTVLNDRSQGGTSIVDGTVELMVHRRLLYDDAFGVGEALSEPGFDGKGLVIRGKLWLLFSSIKDAAKQHRDIAQRLFLEPLITFSTYKTEADYYKNFQTSYSGLVNALPKNVHLLTLEQWKNNSYLLRLEHFYQTVDDPEGLSKPVTVDLKTLFKPFVISEAVEMTLGANQEFNSAKRLEFKISDTTQNEPKKYDFDTQNLTVTLTPMQITTFIIKVKPQKL